MMLSFVSCDNDPQEDVKRILVNSGISEFHSVIKMKNNKVYQEARGGLLRYINRNCKWGIFLTIEENRHFLKNDFCTLISRLREIFINNEINIFVDEGIVSNETIDYVRNRYDNLSVKICRSSTVTGIQLADLVAALCGVRLKAEILGKDKILRYGSEAGFSPSVLAPLGYELWAGLRYSMLHSGKILGSYNDTGMSSFETHGYGFISSCDCPKELIESGKNVFGSIYLGCIH